MSDLTELYQEMILDHNRSPRNFRSMADATAHAKGHNPLCGDNVTIYVKLDGDTIADISFEGSGCAISKASASMMTSELKGKTRAQAEALFERVHDMLTREAGSFVDVDDLGKLAVLSGVCEFPARVKCASLPWHTVHAALAGGQIVSTE
jgi:nitrogen fixation protein NifU and related proteins